MDRMQILESLRSATCPNCQKKKQPKKSFCSRCFFKLHSTLQDQLYRGFGKGYEQAFEESLNELAQVKPKAKE